VFDQGATNGALGGHDLYFCRTAGRTIAESDWKRFRKLHPVAGHRRCERILAEAQNKINRP
jgi:hypothetical protein